MKLRHPFLFLLIVCISFTGSNSAATNQYWNIGSTGGDGIWGTGPGDKGAVNNYVVNLIDTRAPDGGRPDDNNV
jgi:hypothetical protein